MPLVYFISHPEVVVRTDLPVTQWELSPKGLARLERMLEQPWVASIGSVFCSAERKALIAAERLAHAGRLTPVVLHDLGEMDRSSTGVLPPNEFNRVADEFFAKPTESVRGWERAVVAQARIVEAVKRAITLVQGDADIAIVSHGGVGALLKCHLRDVPIHRREDQPSQGHYFVFEVPSWKLRSDWRAIDAVEALK